jgi:hypothetical protein
LFDGGGVLGSNLGQLLAGMWPMEFGHLMNNEKRKEMDTNEFIQIKLDFVWIIFTRFSVWIFGINMD